MRQLRRPKLQEMPLIELEHDAVVVLTMFVVDASVHARHKTIKQLRSSGRCSVYVKCVVVWLCGIACGAALTHIKPPRALPQVHNSDRCSWRRHRVDPSLLARVRRIAAAEC